MEGDKNTDNINTNKRSREEHIYTAAQNLYDGAIALHDVYRNNQARWKRTLEQLKDKDRAYILVLKKTEIAADDPARAIFQRIYRFDRAIGIEAGFVLYFNRGLHMTYGYASGLWRCKAGHVEVFVRVEDGKVKWSSQEHQSKIPCSDRVTMETFTKEIAPYLSALKAFGIHCIDQDSIMCHDVLHYWQRVLIYNIRGHFDPDVLKKK